MKNNIKIIKETETAFDERLCRNGGSYPEYLAEGFYFNKPFVFHDTSCGDFGKRLDLEIGEYSYQFDETNTNGIREYSNFPESYKNILNIFSAEFECEFYTKEELN